MKWIPLVVVTVATLGAMPGTVRGEINCNQVRRYAETGRSAEDISETMIVPLDEVKKCLESKGQDSAPTPEAKAE